VLLVQKAANSRLKVTNQALADARQSISDQLHTSRTRQAELTFKTGLELAERGDVAQGLMWMIESWLLRSARASG